jgi:hypothetical protein
MRQYVGGGWYVHHLTDRVLEIRKDDHVYRRFTGNDGFVRVRGEPGIERAVLVERALSEANKCDMAMAFRVASELIPTDAALADFAGKVSAIEHKTETGEEPGTIGIKRV